jgi:FG-GAP repeat
MRHWRSARRLFATGVLMLGAALPLVGTAGPASASPWPWPSGTAKAAELTATDGGRQAFGWATAVTADGNTALIGAPSRDSDTGAAYLFARTYSGWRQTTELTASDGAKNDLFGSSVAITPDGNAALVGAPSHDRAGAAYLFTRTPVGWQQTAELTASDAASSDAFGTSVAISADGNIALVGAYGNDNQTGAAYVFTRTFTGWRQTAELTASDGADGDFFGSSVAITADGNSALIAAPYRDNYAGAAYVFTRTRTGWQQTTELTASDAASYYFFGFSVAITPDGNTALIGAYGNDVTGAAYVFTRTRTGWQQTTELTASDGGLSDDFGGAVAITADGNTALIGAVYHDNVGAAYVFTRTRTGWQQTTELTASDAANGDEFGFSVAITPDGSTALIGAIGNDMETGAAYVFALRPSWPWPFGILPD